MSCTAASCLAVGNCRPATSGYQFADLAVPESHGTWGPAQEVTLPSDASGSSDESALLLGVHCASGGCTAVGYHTDASGFELMAASRG